MKTVRTVLATLAGVLLVYSLSAWICVRADAAFVQRTIYQGFDQTFIIALVMGVAFLLITVILTVAIASANAEGEDLEEDEEDGLPEEDEEDIPAPKLPSLREQSYHRPTRPVQRNLEEVLAEEEEEDAAEKITFAKQPVLQPEPKPEEKPAEKPVEKPEETAEKKPEEAFVHCIYCGKKVSADSAFCPHCGKNL